jgi:DNA modification methylase
MKQKFNLPNPFYSTKLGASYLGDSLEFMQCLPDDSVDLICTSPPFALVRKKEYGNVDADEYVEWFLNFALEFKRIIKPSGSIIIDIGGSWNKGFPTRSLYHYELLIRLCKTENKGGLGLNLAQELYWYNPAKLPTPAEWVTVRRVRVKDAVNTVWWLSKQPHPKANNQRVLKPYSDAMISLLENGYKPKLRPSGHDISSKFGNDRGGAIPPNIINDVEENFEIGKEVRLEVVNSNLTSPVNLIAASNTASNDFYLRQCKAKGITPHPARFPQALPAFAINLCTEPGDLVLDPFAGSNMTGKTAEDLGRAWLAFEIEKVYLEGSRFRFEELETSEERASTQTIKLEKQLSFENIGISTDA